MPAPSICTAVFYSILLISFGFTTINNLSAETPYSGAAAGYLLIFVILISTGFVLLFIRKPFSRWYNLTILFLASGRVSFVYIKSIIAILSNSESRSLYIPFIIASPVFLVLLVLTIWNFVSKTSKSHYSVLKSTAKPPPLPEK